MEAQNKAVVIEFYERMFAQRELAVADTLIAENYVQHNNVFIPPRREGFKKYFAQFFKTFPESGTHIKQVCAEGDYVFLYATHWAKHRFFTVKYKVIDIYRVENGVLMEHWDTIEGLGFFSKFMYIIKSVLRL
ncbi:ester cyclase [Pseudomonas fuscovaginae UPB0736]|uniref:Predicted SnoaL-like aldol condensation-catalyzing enzyme n=2 Tax=Pseudomonas TaxID=286 RepID=A0A1H1XNC5_9PSED|nr:MULTISPECIES: ester cyclase [Pseudomonas]QXI30651.1 ester cyclase [Pseudomonas vanderleydeniana]UUQ64597.1 ester cyclase [Pseudomonas fuscovaginae UPB0736]UZE26917.1 ester cyclase [Pseudomonas asplenii]SDT10236.1 Predicted SnoaL-like aldol condensation-catalyzing enzyme [Pseudomonas asplenii]SEI21472.1 Predicted SnoaL-like aldol condensation-catalyzing enzyme [Pseudomonas fuscovaginae]